MLTDLQANEQRKKKLSMQSMVDLLIAQALSTTRSREAVYSKVVAGMRLHHADFPEQLASKGAYSQCFKQLGEEPIRQLFVHCAAPRACPETKPEAFWKGMRLMAIDGTLDSVADTESNRQTFRYSSDHTVWRSPYPMVCCMLIYRLGCAPVCLRPSR